VDWTTRGEGAGKGLVAVAGFQSAAPGLARRFRAKWREEESIGLKFRQAFLLEMIALAA